MYDNDKFIVIWKSEKPGTIGRSNVIKISHNNDENIDDIFPIFMFELGKLEEYLVLGYNDENYINIIEKLSEETSYILTTNEYLEKYGVTVE